MPRALTFLVAVAATSAVVATSSFAPGEGQTPAPAQAAQPARPQGNDIKDGVVYDAKQLLAEVAAMVEKQKRAPRTSPAQQ